MAKSTTKRAGARKLAKAKSKTPGAKAAGAGASKLIVKSAPARARGAQPVGSSPVGSSLGGASGLVSRPPPLVAPAKPPRSMDNPPPVLPQPTAVPTDGKPRKNLAGLTPKELEFYRDLILAKRREILGDMTSMELEALRSSGGGTNLSNLPLHMADMGTDNYEQEFTLGLMEKDRKLMRDLNDALAKIQNGTYGICEGTGKPISKARLEAQPWARYSIEYARKLEGRMR